VIGGIGLFGAKTVASRVNTVTGERLKESHGWAGGD
jgi:hypothetical protein